MWTSQSGSWAGSPLPGVPQSTWIEYSHNTLPVTSTGLSPFECSIGYLPPLFPSQEPNAVVPSALAFIRRCRNVWRKASRWTKAAADRYWIPAPRYVCVQKVWLSTKDLPLKAVSRKLAPYVLDPVAVRLKLPSSLGWVHPPALPPLTIMNCSVTEMESFRFLGTTICEKGPAEVVLPSPAEEVQPGTGAAETVLLCHHWIRPLHINNCLVQLSYQIWPQKTTEGCPDCWANHWYNPRPSPRTVLIQSEQKGWQNHSGPLTPSTLPLWTVAVWSTLQSSEHQNDQAQKQFLPSGNPSHELLTINVEHTTLLYIIYSSHILILFSNLHAIPVHT